MIYLTARHGCKSRTWCTIHFLDKLACLNLQYEKRWKKYGRLTEIHVNPRWIVCSILCANAETLHLGPSPSCPQAQWKVITKVDGDASLHRWNAPHITPSYTRKFSIRMNTFSNTVISKRTLLWCGSQPFGFLFTTRRSVTFQRTFLPTSEKSAILFARTKSNENVYHSLYARRRKAVFVQSHLWAYIKHIYIFISDYIWLGLFLKKNVGKSRLYFWVGIVVRFVRGFGKLISDEDDDGEAVDLHDG